MRQSARPDTARVEARLCRGSSPATAADEPPPVFYIELGACFSK
jgi:hypothetical protein